MNTGILIGRLNPPHIGHMRILDESLVKNDKTILFLGSSNLTNKKNPYTFHKRKEFIESIYDNGNLIVNDLKDLPLDKDWIKLINDKLKNIGLNKKDEIIFYGGDLKNDYAILVLRKYIKLLNFNKIKFIEIPRNNYYIEHKNKKIEISSTLVREAIKNNDKELLKKLLNKKIHHNFI